MKKLEYKGLQPLSENELRTIEGGDIVDTILELWRRIRNREDHLAPSNQN